MMATSRLQADAESRDGHSAVPGKVGRVIVLFSNRCFDGREKTNLQMMDFLLALPLWALAVVLNIWLMGFALVSLYAFRRWLLPKLRIHSDAALFYITAVMQSSMLLYGLVAALTAVSVWQRHAQVSDIVSSEATSIASLWRDLDGYPPPVREAMQEVLRGYTLQIIQEAWPLQQQGKIPRQGVEWMVRFHTQLYAYEPVTEGQKILYGETLNAYNRLTQARRARLDSINTALPTVMWFVLLPGAMGCLLLALLFPIEDARFEAVLVVALSGFLAMVLFVIISLDQPFRGPMAITPDSYQLVFDQMMKR